MGVRFSELPSRTGSTGTHETYRYDGWSRMTRWDTQEPGQAKLRRRMRYDGLGRLDLLESFQAGATRDAVEYGYTADNLLVEEARWAGMQVNRILRYSGARYETDRGELLEEVLPMLRLKDGSDGKWVFLDLDGHALAVFDDACSTRRTTAGGPIANLL